jgi:phosphoglycerol transferase MdoB-like AlkP superfamily enzyme
MILALYRFLFSRLFFLMVLFSFCRVLFYLYHTDLYADCTFPQFMDAFGMGLRFDLSILLSFNLLFLLLLSIGRFFAIPSWLFTLFKSLFVLANTLLIAINLIDLEYFRFTGKRTGIEILEISQDIGKQIGQLVFHYWHLLLICILLSAWIFRITFRTSYKAVSSAHAKRNFIIGYAIFIMLGVVGIRGGLQLKPLRPNFAFDVVPAKLGNLVLNTPFNVFMTIGIPTLQEVHFYKDSTEVRNILNEWRKQKNIPHFEHEQPPNVVIIILESFATEYMGVCNPYKGYTPFLDSLARTSLFFPNHYANGKISMHALPSIMAGIPSLMEEPFITSIYQTNTINGLGTILTDHSYHTSFFHAAQNGSMSFDAFTKSAGFESYYGLNEYTGKDADYDGHWGIYDEPYLQYFNKTISTFPQPFAACVFTLSSHQPFSIPEQYKDKFPKGIFDVHESIGYADYALKQFFASAQKEPWYKNTLFIITADHTYRHSKGWTSHTDYYNQNSTARIPLIFFHPSEKLSADTTQVVQQLDIMPSLLHYLNIKNPNPSLLGQSIFGKDPDNGYALYFCDNQYQVYLKGHYIEGNQDHPFVVKDSMDNTTGNASERETRFIRAVIQYYNNGLINNDYYHFGQSLSKD